MASRILPLIRSLRAFELLSWVGAPDLILLAFATNKASLVGSMPPFFAGFELSSILSRKAYDTFASIYLLVSVLSGGGGIMLAGRICY